MNNNREFSEQQDAKISSLFLDICHKFKLLAKSATKIIRKTTKVLFSHAGSGLSLYVFKKNLICSYLRDELSSRT